MLPGSQSDAFDFNAVVFSKSDQLVVLSLLAVFGIAERRFWQLYFQLKRSHLSLSDFWESSPIIKKKFVSENIYSAIKFHINEYKNTDYLEWLCQCQVSPIVWSSDDYPERLKTIDFPPPALYRQGPLPDTCTALAIVGSRRMTAYGEQVLRAWLPEFSRFGLVIVSGAAIGVDRTATQLALEAGGQSITVLGCGHQAPMSYSQRQLLSNWQEHGACILSAFAPGVLASKGSFLARNRIVAGLSAGVLVIEAAEKSGTAHTAGWAAEFGRPLMAVPGSVFNPFAVGTASLINQGGQLVTSAAAVVCCLRDAGVTNVGLCPRSGQGVSGNSWSVLSGSPLASQIINMLSGGEWQFDDLVSKLRQNWLTSEILVAVSELELAEVIERKGTQIFVRQHV